MSTLTAQTRRLAWTLTGMAVVAAVAVVASLGLGWFRAPENPAPSRPPVTTPILREDLAITFSVNAEVGYGDKVPVLCSAAGTVTWLPPRGSAVERGAALLRADDQPVVLLYGPLPMFRRLAVDVRGSDVAQFEANLRALGYDGFPVDQEYSAATERAVKRWQKSLGRPETGAVEPGDVIYAAGPLRIAEHKVRVGAAAAGTVLDATATTKVVTGYVALSASSWAKPDLPVQVIVGNGQTIDGTVTTVGTEAATQSDGSPRTTPDGEATLQVTITVADQASLSNLDRVPVKVQYVAERRPNVLTVPVVALLALAEGGYGVEVVEASASRVIAVEVGAFGAGRVEITGRGLAEGMKVVVPA